MDTSSEEWRHLCECRFWLGQGIRTKGQMEALMANITKKRGAAAAERLRQGMIEERERRRNER